MIHKTKPPFQLHKFHMYILHTYIVPVCATTRTQTWWVWAQTVSPVHLILKPEEDWENQEQPAFQTSIFFHPEVEFMMLNWAILIDDFFGAPRYDRVYVSSLLRESRSNPGFGFFFPPSPRRQESNLLSTCVLIKKQEQQSQPPMNYLSKLINISPNKHHVSIPRLADTVEWMEAQKWSWKMICKQWGGVVGNALPQEAQ